MMNRRRFLAGLVALAAPAVIRTPGLLMPIRPAKLGRPQAILTTGDTFPSGIFPWRFGADMLCAEYVEREPNTALAAKLRTMLLDSYGPEVFTDAMWAAS